MEYIEQWTYAAIFFLAGIPWIELALVVPVGIVIGLNPIAVSIVGFLGNWLTMMLVIMLFDRWKLWRKPKRNDTADNQTANENKRKQRANRIWHRYGLPGLAISGPILIGSHIAAAAAMAFNAPRKLVTVWMTAALAIWTILFAIVAYYGLDAFGIIQTDLFAGE